MTPDSAAGSQPNVTQPPLDSFAAVDVVLKLSVEAFQKGSLVPGEDSISALRRILHQVESIDEAHREQVELLQLATRVRYYLARHTEAIAATAPMGERDMSEPIALYEAVLSDTRDQAAAGHCTKEEVAQALNNLGVCYRQGSMFDEALACYEEAHAIMPNLPMLKGNMDKCRTFIKEKLAAATADRGTKSVPLYDAVNDPAFLLHSIARITGLQSRSDLNGKAAKVTTYDTDKGRYAVEVNGTTILIKPENLRAMREDVSLAPGPDRNPQRHVSAVYSWAATSLGRLDALIGVHGYDQVCPKGSYLAAVHTSNAQWHEGFTILEKAQQQDKRSLRSALRLISDALWNVDMPTCELRRRGSATLVAKLGPLCEAFQPIAGPRDVVAFIRAADLANTNVQFQVEMSIRSASVEAWLTFQLMPSVLGRPLNQAEMQVVLNRATQACMLRCLTCWRAIEQLHGRVLGIRETPAPWDAVENGVKRGIAFGQMQQEQRDTAIYLLEQVKGVDLARCIRSPGPLVFLCKHLVAEHHKSGLRISRDDVVHGACLADSDHPSILEARAACHMNNGLLPRLPTPDETPFARTGFYAAYEDYMACARLAQDGGPCLADGYFWEAANSLGLAGGRDGKGVKVGMLRALAAKAESAEAKARGIYRWTLRNAQAKTAVKDLLKSCKGADSQDVLTTIEYKELARRGMNLTHGTVKPPGIQTLTQYDVVGLGPVWIANDVETDDATKARWKSRILALLRCGYCDQAKDSFEQLKQCSACEAVSYCGRECQKAHWRQHKAQCPEMKKLREAERAAERNPFERRAVSWARFNLGENSSEDPEEGLNWKSILPTSDVHEQL